MSCVLFYVSVKLKRNTGKSALTISRTKTKAASRLACGIAALAVAIPLLTACGRKEEAEAVAPRPVRTVTVQPTLAADTVVLTGHVEARNEAAMAFRLGGRMIERPVNVGDRVRVGQLLARLDPVNEINALRSAQAALTAAQGQLVTAQNAFERQDHLLSTGFTTRANWDQAKQALRNARSQADDAEAQLLIAQDNVSFTELKADVDGSITARAAEPGEVVQAGQMIVRLAHDGGRDAVFDVPSNVLATASPDADILIRLSSDPNVTALGRVREVAPQADPQTRNFAVRIGINNPPAGMLLGSTVTGTLHMNETSVIALPATALTSSAGQPAVFVVDPQQSTVALRPVTILRHDPGTVIIDEGLASGDVVVTAGVQTLHVGQAVLIAGSAANSAAGGAGGQPSSGTAP